MEVLPGEDERTIVRYLSRMAKLTGAEVLVTDDADAFKTAADTVGLKHQVCQQHVVPNTLRLVAEIASDLLGRQDAGTSEKPGDLSSEQATGYRGPRFPGDDHPGPRTWQPGRT